MALVEQNTRIGTPTIASQLTQFEKLLVLHDEVIAGKHPRLKLAAATPPTATAAVAVGPATVGPFPAASVPSKPPDKVTTSSSSLLTAAQQSKPVPSSGARVPTEANARPRTTAADFDPIFLTKSEHLIRAEKRLERERVEKVLKEELQNRRLAEKREIEQQDALPDFDVSEVLQRALELVKPLLASEVIAANVSGSASDSIDNNTLYSSQAESEPEERADLRATKPCRYYFVEGRCLKGDRCDWSHDPAFKRKMQDLQITEGNSREMESDSQQRGLEQRSYGRNGDSSGQAAEDGEIDEGSYSPPRAPPVPLAHEDIQQHKSSSMAAQLTPSRRRVSAHQPLDDGRIIRSHITSPLAPQPSHMSPFVVDKMSRAERVAAEPEPPTHLGSARTARSQYVDTTGQISSSDSIVVTKKRRRGASPTEAHRNVAARRPLAASPIIKAEPVSPAPLPQYGVRQHYEVEEVPPPPVVYRPSHVRQPSGYDAGRERVYVEVPDSYRVMTPSRRVVTGSSAYERREPELRRIVSARPPEAYAEQYERNPAAFSPRIEPAAEYYRRPVSRATVVDVDPSTVYRASMQPQATYLRPSSSGGPAQYSAAQREPRTAPRRIVVDQYGNRYYEAPAESAQRTSYSVMPEAPARTYEYPPRQERGYEPQYRRASPEPVSPGYVPYREIQPPPPTAPPPARTSSRALSHVPPPTAAVAAAPSSLQAAAIPGSVVYEQGVDGGYRARAVRPATAGREREVRAAPPREYEAGDMPPPLPPASAAGLRREPPPPQQLPPRVAARRYYEHDELVDVPKPVPREQRYAEAPAASPPQARYYAADIDPHLHPHAHQHPHAHVHQSPVVYTRRAYIADAAAPMAPQSPLLPPSSAMQQREQLGHGHGHGYGYGRGHADEHAHAQVRREGAVQAYERYE